jgi:hypothetical protein
MPAAQEEMEPREERVLTVVLAIMWFLALARVIGALVGGCTFGTETTLALVALVATSAVLPGMVRAWITRA